MRPCAPVPFRAGGVVDNEGVTDDEQQTASAEMRTIKLSESDVQRGAQVMSTQMAGDYAPPSASLSPAIHVEPPNAVADASSADGSGGSETAE